MIPYFSLSSFALGPLQIQVWGLAVAFGMLVGVLLARRLALKAGLDGEVVLDLAVWTLIPALVAARIFFFLLYDFGALMAEPWSIVRIWDGGMSSFGGYLGAAIGGLAYMRHRRLPFRPYAEVAAYVLPLGYGIGRLGCFFIHDHPGVLSDCFFAVAFPDGSRLDHGLLLSLFGFALFVLFALLRRFGWKVGQDRWRYVPTLLLVYGLTRFVLDFFRAWDLTQSDVRYLYLTPSQYGALIFVVIGIMLAIRGWRNTKESSPR
jgi:phosphatidylglycerol:prolipoprotein diacylglycerol transferase